MREKEAQVGRFTCDLTTGTWDLPADPRCSSVHDHGNVLKSRGYRFRQLETECCEAAFNPHFSLPVVVIGALPGLPFGSKVAAYRA